MQQHSSQQGQHACQANLLRVCHTRGESFLLKNLPQIKKVSTVTVATGAAAKNLDAGDYPQLLKLYASMYVASHRMLELCKESRLASMRTLFLGEELLGKGGTPP